MVIIAAEDSLASLIIWFFIGLICVLVGVFRSLILKKSGVLDYEDDLNYFWKPDDRALHFGDGDKNQTSVEMSPSQISQFRKKAKRIRKGKVDKLVKLANEIKGEKQVEATVLGDLQFVDNEDISMILPKNWDTHKFHNDDESIINSIGGSGEYFYLLKKKSCPLSHEDLIKNYFDDNLSAISNRNDFRLGNVQWEEYKGQKTAYCGYCCKINGKMRFGYVMVFATEKNEMILYHAMCYDDWSRLCSKEYMIVRDSISVL